jgi:RimJ/RimL family protein N-acetyltransferase
MTWPAIEAIRTERLHLEPLRVEHADAMVGVLSAPALYEFTGGSAPTAAQLRRRYQAQAVGHSGDQRQWWLNWIVAEADSGGPVGYVQATVECVDDVMEADLAWVIQPGSQRRGFATEAARGLTDWLVTVGVERFAAYIHPTHYASSSVARALGMLPSNVVEDGEIRWESNRERATNRV